MFHSSPIASNDHAELIARHIEVARWDRDADAYTHLGDDFSYPSICRGYDSRISPGTEVINGATGEITAVPQPAFYRGGDLTVSQLAERLGMGPRKTRATLAGIGILHEELEAKMVPMVSDPMQRRPEYSSRLRLSEWAVKMRYGRRVVTGVGYDLDWITPAGLAYIEGMLSNDVTAKVPPKREPKAIEVISRLLTTDPTLRQVDIMRLTGLSKMTVHRNLRLLGKR